MLQAATFVDGLSIKILTIYHKLLQRYASINKRLGYRFGAKRKLAKSLRIWRVHLWILEQMVIFMLIWEYEKEKRK